MAEERNTLTWRSIEQLPRAVCSKIARFFQVAELAATVIQRRRRGRPSPLDGKVTLKGGYRQPSSHQKARHMRPHAASARPLLPPRMQCISHAMYLSAPPAKTAGAASVIVFAVASVQLDATDEAPYLGSRAFGGRFSAADARRAGFFSAETPPDEGGAVACFRRGAHWQRQGRVVSVELDAVSDGRNGLLAGAEGTLVRVACESAASGGGSGSGGGGTFEAWASLPSPSLHAVPCGCFREARRYQRRQAAMRHTARPSPHD
mmetsp:Transcript_2939/g.8848  ORF Transcript_2939/g.8848 Transcript_2939/m.8848 type:complete len:262 (+) Transcript_2939:166-951(+)